MKLVRWGAFGAERPGVLTDDGDIVDVSSVVDDYDGAFLSGSGLEALREALAGGGLPTVPAGTRLGAPVARPQAVIAIGLNYADHARESGMEPPSEPVVFTKLPNTVCGPNDDVVIPRGSTATDYEVELAVVIGQRAHYLADPAASGAHIAGFCLANDVSERDHQLERGGQWIKGKANRNFNPLGPWLVTPDEIEDVQQLELRLSVNGEQRQSSTTAQMIFDVAHIVWYLSQFMVLEPGDVIVTGTPPGVGMGFDPPRYLRAGDVVELEIDGLGAQRSNVVEESA
jgi:2-keto-4-pentenoate hydratase/2-oxohepta-3-ene-1,7-dioic acid hydratase in catechol pathway